MRISTMLSWAMLTLTANAFADGTHPQGGASATSSTEASANRNSTSATNSSPASASANAPQARADAVGSSEMSATLSKPVDARKAKSGDPVLATTDQDAKAADGTPIKRGSTLVGHVTQAKPLEKSAFGNASATGDSMLSIVFDKAILKGGREVPLNATIQALSAAESEAAVGSDMGSADLSTVGSGAGSARAAGGGLIGGVGSSVAGGLGAAGNMGNGVSHDVNGTVGGMANSRIHSIGSVGGLSSNGVLTSGSHGVFGIKNLEIASSSEVTAITSSARNVRLDGGTRMLLSNRAGSAVMASGATQAAGSVSKNNAPKDSTGSAAAPQATREPRDKH
jgi:hypothetical protein